MRLFSIQTAAAAVLSLAVGTGIGLHAILDDPAAARAATPARWDHAPVTVYLASGPWSAYAFRGIDEWAIARVLPIKYVDDPAAADIVVEQGRPVVDINASDTGIGVVATATPTVDGASITQCRIVIDSDRFGAQDYPLVAHEFGHCLGLGHAAGRSVMHWFAGDVQGGWSDHVTPADLDRLRALYAPGADR